MSLGFNKFTTGLNEDPSMLYKAIRSAKSTEEIRTLFEGLKENMGA